MDPPTMILFWPCSFLVTMGIIPSSTKAAKSRMEGIIGFSFTAIFFGILRLLPLWH